MKLLNKTEKGLEKLVFLKKLLFLVLIAFLIPFALAAEFKAADTVIIDEVIKDNLYLSGGEIAVNEIVRGDVVAAGGKLEFNNVITEDLMAAGGQIEVNNNVQGDARIAAGQVSVDATINKDLVILGGSINLRKGTLVNGDVSAFGGQIDIKGDYNGDLRASGGTVRIDAKIAGNVEIESENIKISKDTVIDGNLTYTSDKELDIDPSQVRGDIRRIEPKIKKVKAALPFPWKFISFGAWLILALICAALFPKFFEKTSSAIKKSFWKSTLMGLLILIVTPIALMIILITVIGIPIAVVGFMLYIVAVYLSKIITAHWLGSKLYRKGKYIKMILGVVILTILFWIPFIGWILKLGTILVALGSVTQIPKARKKKK